MTLTDNATNLITGGDILLKPILDNVDNTISGAGDIGGGAMGLINEAHGVIDATGASNRLIINTGTNTFTNAGTIEASGAAGLVVGSAISNSRERGYLCMRAGGPAS